MQSYLFIHIKKDQPTLVSNLINSSLESDHIEVSKYLANSPPSFLLQLLAVNKDSLEKSKKVREFCEKKDSVHVQAWADTLKKQHHIGNELLSLDKKERCTTLDQYLGVFYFKQFNDLRSSNSIKSLLALQKSSELNFFPALVVRAKMSGEALKKDSISPDEWSTTRTLLLRDLTQLGKFYRTLGYLHSTMLLLELGVHFANKRKEFSLADAASEEACMEDENLKLLAIQFFTLAAKNFLFASFLLSNKTSREISNFLCQNKELGSVFGFKNLGDGQSFIKNLIEGYIDEATYQKIQGEVKEKISAALIVGGTKLRNSPRHS